MEKEEILFETKDYNYLITDISMIISSLILLILMFSFGASLEDRGLHSFRSLLWLTVGAILLFLMRLTFFYNSRKILFYKNKIVLNISKYDKKEIRIIDIKESYKLSPYHHYSNTRVKVLRWNTFRKVLLILLFPLTFVSLLVMSIGFYLGTFIVFRSFLLKRYKLLVIGKTDVDFFVVHYSGEKQMQIENYFRQVLNIEVRKMTPTYWFFIPIYKKDK